VALWYTLDDLRVGPDENVWEGFRKWREAIENANNVTVTGDCTFSGGPGQGWALDIPKRGGGSTVYAGVVTEAISAAPSDDTMGSGKVMLKTRDGADLADLREVDTYSYYSIEITVGTHVKVALDGPDGILLGADCPTPPV
jgi:hypothetical protein